MSETIDREVLLSLKHVEISFDNGGKTKFKAVQDANFDIYKGETFALVGESGSGKTTIGRAIMRINELSDGEISFDGRPISAEVGHRVENFDEMEADRIWQSYGLPTFEYDPEEGPFLAVHVKA